MALPSSVPPRAAQPARDIKPSHHPRSNHSAGDGPRTSTIRKRLRTDPVDHFATHPPRYAASALEAAGDIPLELKRRILNAYHGLEGKNFYELLGVDRQADKRTLRDAYFGLAKVFHPDSQFGTDLGSFTAKMEAVFKRLTDAYHVLGNARRRALYDEQLGPTPCARAGDPAFDALTQPSGVRRISGEANDSPRSLSPRSADERRARVRDRRRRI